MIKRILGVDPGLASTGWGVIESCDMRIRYIDHGCIETTQQDTHSKRLLMIYTGIKKIIEKYAPKESAIENLYFAKNVKSAMPVAEARGVLCMALAEAGIDVREFSPNSIKLATSGVGGADKRQVQEMVRIILGLSEIPKPDHAADALAAAICCANNQQF